MKKRVNQKKIKLDGYEFDSIAEAEVYLDLKNDPKVKIINVHPRFDLLPGLSKINIHGKKRKYQGIKYTADFLIVENQKTVVIDVKSRATLKANSKSWPMRRKLFLQKFPEYYFREIIVNSKKKEVKDY